MSKEKTVSNMNNSKELRIWDVNSKQFGVQTLNLFFQQEHLLVIRQVLFEHYTRGIRRKINFYEPFQEERKH